LSAIAEFLVKFGVVDVSNFMWGFILEVIVLWVKKINT